MSISHIKSKENSGHELGYDEISATKDWLSNLPKNSP